MAIQHFEGGTFLPMDTTSLYYFQELTKDLHMTRTAERLFISQQTLSNHILRLEKQLGCQLFYRKPALSLTYAGEQVLAFAERTIRDQINLQDILSDVEDQKRGSIRFGASTLRMNACLPVILPCFLEEYPLVELQITDQTSRRLEPLILNGELDIALVAGEGMTENTPSRSADKKKGREKEDPVFVRELLIRDPIYLCITDSLLRKQFGGRAEEILKASRHGADLKHYRNVPFMLYKNRMGILIHRCFEDAGYEPHSYLLAPYTQIITRIGLQGTAAFFSTRVVLSSQREDLPPDLHIFPLLYRGKPLYQEIYLLHSRDRYIPRFTSRFLELLRECFQGINDTPLEDKEDK
ncbi:MAG: LysR family transcriptional regulator [Eubacteriales bacterium]|nr:LysR family transcriptional regulator [Eubacteriales bacterium]